MSEDSRTAGFQRMLDYLNERHLLSVDDVREVWLIRHADAYVGLDELEAGIIDPPLSERGREQADRLAARLAGVPLQAIWASDLRRARETAEAIARGRSLEVRTDPRLREVRTFWDEAPEFEWQPPEGYPFPEPEAEVVARMRAMLDVVLADLVGASASRPRAAVVSHNAAIAVLVSNLLGLEWNQLRMMPQFTSVTVLAARDDRIVVQSIADATHLTPA